MRIMFGMAVPRYQIMFGMAGSENLGNMEIIKNMEFIIMLKLMENM